MGTPEITAADQKMVSESRDAVMIKVRNEDELRLAQMGESGDIGVNGINLISG
jgi:hypothetical protein